jgi:hypothetical protein
LNAHARAVASPAGQVAGVSLEPFDRLVGGHRVPDVVGGRLTDVTDQFEPISLAEALEIAAPDRTETRFLLDVEALPPILETVAPFYRILEIDGRRIHRYRTRYYDTVDLRLYHAHQTGRVPRYKVRIREYLDTETAYAEIKQKTNRGRTLKFRIPVGDGPPPFAELFASVMPHPRLPDPTALREAARIDYRRITLVSRDGTERATFDLNLECSREDRTRAYPGCVVAEVKQEHRTRTPVIAVLRRARIREAVFSKYCVCLASLETRLKQNQFKPTLTLLARSFSPPEAQRR